MTLEIKTGEYECTVMGAGELACDIMCAVRKYKSQNKLPLNSKLDMISFIWPWKEMAGLEKIIKESWLTDLMAATGAHKIEINFP